MAGESASESARRMREKSERLARTAELYERGAEGERATAEALGALPSEKWMVFHDLRWPGRRYANVDHVVVGPPGVFVIDSKNWSGEIRVVDGILRQNGRAREQAVSGVAEAATAVVSQLAGTVAPHALHPVLCFVRPDEVIGRARDVMLCSTANVTAMLQTRPAVLSDGQRRQLCIDLDASFSGTVASGRSAPVRSRRTRHVAAGAATPSGSARRPRSRVVKAFVAILPALLVLTGLFVVATTDVTNKFGETFVSLFVDDDADRPADPPERKRDKPGQR